VGPEDLKEGEFWGKWQRDCKRGKEKPKGGQANVFLKGRGNDRREGEKIDRGKKAGELPD